MTNQNIRLGLLSPATPNRPHFKHVDALLPAGVSLIHEGLGLLGESYQDLAGKADQVIAKATDFVRRNEVQGLILTGGFIGLFNPGIDGKVSAAIHLPVVTAVSSAVAALKVFSAKSVLLMTPFDAKSDAVIKDHLNGLGFTVYLGPAFEGRKAGSGVDLNADQLFDLVVNSYRSSSAGRCDLLSRRNHGPAADHSKIGRCLERPGYRQQSGDDLEHAIDARRQGVGQELR